MEPRLSSIVIHTSQAESVLKFYSRLGLEFEHKQISKGGQCYKAFVGGVELTIYRVDDAVRPRTPHLQLTFHVPGLDELVAELSAIDGVECLLDPTVLPDGKKAILLDPDGRSVELIEA